MRISLEGREDLQVIDRGTLKAVIYRDEVLQAIVKPFAGAVVQDFILMEDKAPSSHSQSRHSIMWMESTSSLTGQLDHRTGTNRTSVGHATMMSFTSPEPTSNHTDPHRGPDGGLECH